MREHVGEFVDERRAAFDDAVNEGRAAAEKARAEMMGAYDASAPARARLRRRAGPRRRAQPDTAATAATQSKSRWEPALVVRRTW
jgi:hypothetical protein